LLNNNKIVATRVVLPVSESQQFPSKYGLRHRAALGITEKTDALVIVISEQTGKITYVKNSEFETLKSVDQLKSLLQHDLSL
jgi:DNA integrity scanning protein DisA with diadenylate cyclase activity